MCIRDSDADLTNLFAEFGEVSSAKVIFDRETGRSREMCIRDRV